MCAITTFSFIFCHPRAIYCAEVLATIENALRLEEKHIVSIVCSTSPACITVWPRNSRNGHAKPHPFVGRHLGYLTALPQICCAYGHKFGFARCSAHKIKNVGKSLV
ncbi:MAG: hypothetical protein BYD32DRAFT_409747, partial [Podila humilis]